MEIRTNINNILLAYALALVDHAKDVELSYQVGQWDVQIWTKINLDIFSEMNLNEILVLMILVSLNIYILTLTLSLTK